MGRASRAVAEQHHRQLIEAAARLFRERDLGAVSVPDVMGEIGLTRGGFYKHFESKDALVAAAVTQAFREHLDRLDAFSEAHDHDPIATRQAFVDFCLSFAHRDNPGDGCPSAFASGISRTEPGSAPRVAYTEGMRTLLAVLAERTATDEADAAVQRERIICDFSILVGALLLARATAGDCLSEEFLAAARDRLAQ
ncbi:helix-turn-helix domain-containing protein [Sporichthya brevicatena]|uniref:helix-turn-helix domain-containing protein n=1 Tax=Sporichthya brevicatena TaxID=171442 RepID=UPI0031D9B399